MEVTPTELIYIDSKTRESWRWPRKYLRNYGCDGDVFSFEAGRKCPGGEGLYAFSSKRASLLFDTVAKNINQGNLQPPPGEMSPFPSDAQRPDPNTLSFSRRQSGTQSPTHDQPNYANMDPSGRPLVENGAIGSTSDSEAPRPDSPSEVNQEPMKFLYREVVFEKPPEDHPMPESGTQQKTQIDFDQTDKFNRDNPGLATSLPRTSTSSIGAPSSARGEKKSAGRRRMQTYSGGTHRSPSESGSHSSQSSPTESSRELRSPGQMNGGVPLARTSITEQSGMSPMGSMYQNVVLGGASPGVQQPNYQNVNIGSGSVNCVFESPQQPNYQNVSLPSQSSKSSVNGAVVGGDPRGQYADLQLSGSSNRNSANRKRSTSTSYMQLEFSKHDKSISSSHSSLVPQPSAGGPSGPPPEPTRASTDPVIPQQEHPKTNGHSLENTPSLALPVTSSHVQLAVVDETKVAYAVLDFPAMEVLSELSREREQDKKLEHKERDRTLHSGGTHSKKKK